MVSIYRYKGAALRAGRLMVIQPPGFLSVGAEKRPVGAEDLRGD